MTWCADRVVSEARESRRDGLDLRFEPVVDYHPVDVSVLLRARSIEIVGHEEDLECPAATHQAGEPGHRTASGNHTDADFPLAEKRVLARGEPQIAGEHELASRATGARPGIEAMLTTGARASRTRTSTQAGSPVGLSPESRALSDGPPSFVFMSNS